MNDAPKHEHQPCNVVESFLKCKDGVSPVCGDNILISDSYIAVIDGATPKGQRLWDGMKGDAFIAKLLKTAVADLSPNLTAQEAIEQINTAVKKEYEKAGTTFEALPPEERLQASIVIYSAHRREIWLFGDCQFRVNGENFNATRKGDMLFSDLRAFCIELARLEGLDKDRDHGREAIMPFIKKYMLLANTDSEFGYDVINGGSIRAHRVLIHPVNAGDFAVLSSDGYPTLF